MNPFDMIELLKDLPDDIIESANRPRQRRSHSKTRLKYVIPTLAACFIGLLCLTINPALNISTPESIIITNTSSMSESITSTVTTDARSEMNPSNSTSDNGMTITTSQRLESTVSSVVTDISEHSSITVTTSSESTISNEESSSISTRETTATSEVSTLPNTDDTAVDITNKTETTRTTTETTASTKTILYTLDKSICPLPELVSGGTIDPTTGHPVPLDAQIDYDGEKWNVVLTESCEDACIVSGVLIDHVLYLSVACLSAQEEYSEETIRFSLVFFDDVNIADIHVEREDFIDATEFNEIYTKVPVILNDL